jgi:hypothetical protein
MRSFFKIVGSGTAAALAVTAVALAPGPAARADSPAAPLPTAASGPTVSDSAPGPGVSEPGLVPMGGDVATLAPGSVYRLSPQLAGLLGTATLDEAGLARLRAGVRPGLSGEHTPPVGTTLFWPALDVAHGIGLGIYLKQYTLRAVGEHIEVWVASGCDAVSCGTALPAGDCRNQVPGSSDVTDDQIKSMVHAFDSNMYPKETAAFSVPPDHNGTATVPGLAAAGLDFSGDGARTVTLVDMIRQPNFYEFPKNQTYIAGFYAPIFNQITDRNVITVDAFDWAHRTGANPPDAPKPGDLCVSRSAHPFLYESVFGHEWQHLLEHYQNGGQTTWVNEGLSMFAEALDGYTDTRRHVDQTNSQPQLLCFQGFGTVKGPSNPNPRACGGPGVSLTVWGDQGQSDPILASYGSAWSFMLYCYDRFGLGFISALHRDGAHVGLASVQAALDTYAKGTKVATLLHEFQLMNLIDHYAKHGTVIGIDRSVVTAKDLDAMLNLDNPAALGKDGAAPNGADYLLLRDGERVLPGSALRSFSISAAKTLAAPAGDPNDPTSILGGSSDTATPIDGWYISLVGIDPKTNRVLVNSHAGFDWTPDAKTLAAYRSYPQVVAVIAHDNTDDTNAAGEQHAVYTPKINGH